MFKKNKNEYDFKKWMIVDDTNRAFEIKKVISNKQLLDIFLQDQDNKKLVLKITFKKPIAYHLAEDGILLNNWHVFEGRNINCFFKSKNSAYIENLYHYSYNLHLPKQIMHYGCITEDECIDVISETEPTHEWVVSD